MKRIVEKIIALLESNGYLGELVLNYNISFTINGKTYPNLSKILVHIKPKTMIEKEGVRIEKSRSKKQPFKVTFIAKNREPLATPELFTNHKNALKNICAIGKLWDGGGTRVEPCIIVYDLSQKTGSRYRLYLSGNIEQIDVV